MAKSEMGEEEACLKKQKKIQVTRCDRVVYQIQSYYNNVSQMIIIACSEHIIP